jgi:YVTN family beta-propeller protein
MKEITFYKKCHGSTLIKVFGILTLVLLVQVNSAGAGPFAYIANWGSNSVSVIDTATNTVSATVNVGNYPVGVAVNPDGTKVYVTNNMGSYPNLQSIVSVIDTATNKVTANISLGNNPFPADVAVSPDGTKVYALNNMGNYPSLQSIVSVIDTATNTVASTVKVGLNPLGLDINPDGTKVYVTDPEGKTVSIIDTATNTVSATVNVGGTPTGVAVSPDGTKVYVTAYNLVHATNGLITMDGMVDVISPSSNTVITSITGFKHPYHIAVAPDGSKVYLIDLYSNTVIVIDAATNNVKATIPVGNFTTGVSITPDGKKLYVVDSDSNSVSVIDVATNTVIASIPVGDKPNAFGHFIGPLSNSPQPKPILPIAKFSAYPNSGKAPLKVQFTDLSENASSRNWYFGDGFSTTEPNPKHTYSLKGDYTVYLVASNKNGTDVNTLPVKVQAPAGFNFLIFLMIVLYLLRKSI